MGIDLLALDAWADAAVVGYEVKVSRGDMRTELLRPWKRQRAVASTTKFYFAVPKGLLTFDELAYTEPEWPDGSFDRVECPWPCRKTLRRNRGWARSLSAPGSSRGMLRVPVPAVLSSRYAYLNESWTFIKCPNCKGKSYVDKSIVEKEAPTLWVPNDVGLIEVDGRGCHEVRRSPKRKMPDLLIELDRKLGIDEESTNRVRRQQINTLVRWASARPDPRHANRSLTRA